MPKLEGSVQEPLPLYPPTEVFNPDTGLITATLEDMPWLNPDSRITLGRLAAQYGSLCGPTECVRGDYDSLLQAAADDFKHASIASIESGLYIYPEDPRFHKKSTEQMIKADNWFGRFPIPGVVFHSSEFQKVDGSPVKLATRTMARTRDLNSGNCNRPDVEGRVGRSGGHVIKDKMKNIDKVDSGLIALRNTILVPLSSETNSTWRAHYKTKNLDKKFKIFVDEAHNTLETASINLNVGTVAIKGAHRALTSRLTRNSNSRAELNRTLKEYLYLSRKYVQAKRLKIRFARNQCEEALEAYKPFLEAVEQ